MNQDDIARYPRRVAEERALASSASDARVAKSHLELAEKYGAVAAAYQARTKPRDRGMD
jgi:hypothetical protein